MKYELIQDILLLYIEDDDDTRQTMLRFLKRRIANVIVASNGEEGYNLYKKHKPDIIITDIKMPVMSGLEMCSMIRDDDDDTIVIITSAHSETHYFQEAINLGVNNFLVKPLDLSQLYCTLKIICENIFLKRENKSNEKLVNTKTYELEDRNNELKNTIFHLNEAQKKLVEVEKMASLGELVAGVTHEINTPLGVGLTSITYFLQINEEIRKNYNDKEMTEDEFENYLNTSEELATMIYINLERSTKLIKSFKQVAIDQTNEEKREFNLEKYLEEIIFSLNYMIKRTNIVVDLECDSSIIVNSFAGVFSQMITNFMQNSVKHAFSLDEKGLIYINAKKDNKNLILSYEDDGKGISNENIKRIFEPFFTTKKDDGGTGLGLSIIYNIVATHLEGNITCKSEIGKGTKFIVTIPLEKI